MRLVLSVEHELRIGVTPKENSAVFRRSEKKISSVVI